MNWLFAHVNPSGVLTTLLSSCVIAPMRLLHLTTAAPTAAAVDAHHLLL
jgi:hypothetical protein